MFDIAFAVALTLFFLILLGVMRETVLLRGQVTALSQLITKPPVPSFLGDRLPAIVRQELVRTMGATANRSGAHVLLFLRPGCNGCFNLTSQIVKAIETGLVNPDDLSCVVEARSKDVPLFQTASAISKTTLLDTTGAIRKACEIHAVPTQFVMTLPAMKVVDYKPGGDVEWMVEVLQTTREPTAVKNSLSSAPA